MPEIGFQVFHSFICKPIADKYVVEFITDVPLVTEIALTIICTYIIISPSDCW